MLGGVGFLTEPSLGCGFLPPPEKFAQILSALPRFSGRDYLPQIGGFYVCRGCEAAG